MSLSMSLLIDSQTRCTISQKVINNVVNLAKVILDIVVQYHSFLSSISYALWSATKAFDSTSKFGSYYATSFYIQWHLSTALQP